MVLNEWDVEKMRRLDREEGREEGREERFYPIFAV